MFRHDSSGLMSEVMRHGPLKEHLNTTWPWVIRWEMTLNGLIARSRRGDPKVRSLGILSEKRPAEGFFEEVVAGISRHMAWRRSFESSMVLRKVELIRWKAKRSWRGRWIKTFSRSSVIENTFCAAVMLLSVVVEVAPTGVCKVKVST